MDEPKVLPNGAASDPAVRERVRAELQAAWAECEANAAQRRERSRARALRLFGPTSA